MSERKFSSSVIVVVVSLSLSIHIKKIDCFSNFPSLEQHTTAKKRGELNSKLLLPIAPLCHLQTSSKLNE